MRPSAFALGRALLVAAVVVDASLWAYGAVAGPAEPPIAQTVTLGDQQVLALCNGSSVTFGYSGCYHGFTPVGAAYVPAGQRWVIAGGDPFADPASSIQGGLFETPQNLSKVTAGAPTACQPAGLTYSGSGPDLLANCRYAGTSNSSLETFDWATRQIVGSTFVGTTQCYLPFLGLNSSMLLCPAGTTAASQPAYLLELQSSTGAILSNDSFPGPMQDFTDCLLWDAPAGKVLGVTSDDGMVFLLDPTTGQTTKGPVLGQSPNGCAYDPSHGLYFVVTPATGGGRDGRISVIDAANLTVVRSIFLPGGSVWGGPFMADGSRGDVWLMSYGGLEVLNLSRGDFVANFSGVASLPSEQCAIAPGGDVIVGAQWGVGLQPSVLIIQPFSTGRTPSVPYQTVPGVGEMLPWAVAVPLAVGGGVLLAKHYWDADRAARRARWKEREAEFEARYRPPGD